jgi:2-dehydro-3-deoxyphosphogalactonate aldolase
MWGGPFIAAAAIQIDTCCLNFLIQESHGVWDGMHAEILTDPIEWRDGFIIPSERPGLGYELNEDVARRNDIT